LDSAYGVGFWGERVSEIKSAFKALSPEQRAVVEQQGCSGAHSTDEWLELLTAVAEFDKKADEVRAGAGGFFARRFARRHDLPFGLRLFALPLLPILREDHDPGTPLDLKLDLTGPEQNSKVIRTSDPYKKGAYHKIVDTFYDDPWIEGHAKFVDGTDLRFSVIDHVRSQSKTKRNPRGKIKRKTKAKKKTELAVTVTFPARNYAAAKSQASQSADIRKESVKAGEDRTVVRLSKVVELARTDGVPQPEHLLELVAEAYQRVDPSRRKKL
jgi:hypothetical protein